MSKHSFDVQWRYVVPPTNCTRVVITQRQDGPFSSDAVGAAGHYYVSMETYMRDTWIHVTGSSDGGFKNFQTAHDAASRMWSNVARSITAAG